MGAFDFSNVALDVFCALLCAMMGAYVLLGSDRHDKTNRYFAGISFTNAVMALGDTTSWVPVPPFDQVQYVVVMAGSFLYYLSVVPMYMFFTGYIVTYLSRRVAFSSMVPRGIRRAFFVIVALYAACCIASLGNGVLFTVTYEGGYVRGPWFWVAQAVPFALHVLNTVIIVRHFSALSVQERFGFASYILIPAVADVVQVASFGIALLNPAITVVVLIIFMSIQSERKALLAVRDRELAEMRADVMLSQIQPHFLYNTLTAIRGLCVTDPQEAARVVTDFSAYLRENMASLTSREPISFERELGHVRTYLALEKKRFGSRLRVEYDVRAAAFSLPPLSLQALVENAVRHGVAKREEGGTVRVRAWEEPDAFVVEVEDDGMGFDAAAEPDDGRVHVGVANVRSRVESLCGGALELKSEPGVGTCATLRLPKGFDRLESMGGVS